MKQLNRIELFRQMSRMTAYASGRHPGLAYYVYLPGNYGGPDQPERYRLLVLMHGIERSAEAYRDQFRQLAREHDLAVMAPLFPADSTDLTQMNDYDLARPRRPRYDLALLDLVGEMGERFPVDTRRFALFGFSAGGQFAHRFLYLHPERLSAVSIGAPSQATYPDESQAWPEGWGGTEALFGRRPELKAFGGLKIQIVVGDQDLGPRPGPDGAQNRLERARLLYQAYRRLGLEVRLDICPGLGHEGFNILPWVRDFLGDCFSITPTIV